ncbi:hypothetical protein Tco_1032298 [Tanacetum coccineum]|uniref:Uncharacterized protein n=1 Tax=Tanacetum coccineum TaxID=301880 RepID=A0ABQ5GDS5_9ASTR
MARQCTKPKSPRNSTWFKEKMLLAEALESREIPTLAIFQTDDLDAFNSYCDEAPSASAFLMAKLFAYDSDVFSEMSNQVVKCNEVDKGNKTVNESLTAELERYKEQIKFFEERQNFDLNDREKYIDSQLREVIVDTNAKLEAKNNSINKLKDRIATLKGKSVSAGDKSENISKVITPGMYKLDLEPLSPKLLKNREAYVDYLKHTQENADTLCEIVEQARALRPLDRVISSTSANGSKPLGNTKKNRISRPTSSNKKNKVEDRLRSIKSSLNKKNHVFEYVCNINIKHSILNANSELIYATCNECMFNSIHDLCVLNYLNDVNVHVNPKFVKSKNKKVWKPTGKVFTNVRYRWKPTGQTFTIDGNKCSLTRITSTTVVPPKKLLSTTVVKKTPPSSNTSEQLKDITNLGRSNRPLVPGLGLL